MSAFNALNMHGLKGGKIPSGEACPFFHGCRRRDGNCPTAEAPKSVDFSCAVARLHSLIKEMGGS